MIRRALLSTMLASACLASGSTPKSGHDMELPPPETGTILPDSTFSIEDGDVCINGHPRFLIGTVLFEGVDHDTGIKTTGYSPDLAWLYESLPNYQNAQALGLDIFGVTPEHTWRRIFRPKPIPRRNMTALNRPLNSGLPIIAELAIEKDSHAWMTFMDGVNPKEYAWIEGDAQSIPYSIVTAEGLELWSTIWRTSAQYFHNLGVKPFAYRLFAGADMFDTSFAAQAAFGKYLNEMFVNIAALNQTIDGNFTSFNQAGRAIKNPKNSGLEVLYTEFLEKAWVHALIRATSTIASVTGETAPTVFFQPKSLESQSIDLFSAALPQALLCAPAEQDNPMLTALLLRAAACGKPLVICDVPVRNNDTHLRNTLLTQFARGYSLAFIRTWKRDARAWIRYQREIPSDGSRPRTVLDPIATELAGKQHALANPDHMLNPYAVQTSTLGGFRMAKQDAFTINDLFANKHRSAGVEVALLYARTSARLRGTTHDITPTNDMATCMTALADAGYKLDGIAETQLSVITNTSYRVIVISDTAFATQANTATQLMLYVQSGGTVILTAHALTRNAYGKQLNGCPFSPSEDWTHSELHGIQLHRKSFGTGHAIRLQSVASAKTLQLILDALISETNVSRTWQSVDSITGEPLTGIEVAHAVNAGGLHGLILFNRTEKTYHVRFSLTGIRTPYAFDTILKKTLPTEASTFLIELKPQHGEIITVSESRHDKPEGPE